MKTIAKIYYPINDFHVHEVIPLGDNVIYSTLMKARFFKGKEKREYITRVVMTPSGFAWEDRRDPNLMFSEMGKFFEWSQITMVSGSQIFIGERDHFELYRRYKGYKKIYETNKTFKERSSEFEAFILPYIKEFRQKEKRNNSNENIRELTKQGIDVKIYTKCSNCNRQNKNLYYFCQYCGKNLATID